MVIVFVCPDDPSFSGRPGWPVWHASGPAFPGRWHQWNRCRGFYESPPPHRVDGLQSIHLVGRRDVVFVVAVRERLAVAVDATDLFQSVRDDQLLAVVVAVANVTRAVVHLEFRLRLGRLGELFVHEPVK